MKKKRKHRPLLLSVEHLRELQTDQLAAAAGGRTAVPPGCEITDPMNCSGINTRTRGA